MQDHRKCTEQRTIPEQTIYPHHERKTESLSHTLLKINPTIHPLQPDHGGTCGTKAEIASMPLQPHIHAIEGK